MRLLAWDTSSRTGTLVALEWDQRPGASREKISLVGEWTLNVEAIHSERLLWAVHELLECARWKLADVDVFGVGVGPGSFTGLRIGVTTARTLAHTLKKPLVGVSSLAALTRPVAEWASSHSERIVLVGATDACKGELYAIWGSARSLVDCVVMADGDHRGLWKRGVEEKVLRPGELVRAIKRKLSEGKGGRWVAIGEARQRYSELWKELPEEREFHGIPAFSQHVQGRYLGTLAWEAFQAGLSREPLNIHPRYLRAPDAEIKLKAGLLPPAPVRVE